MFIRRNFVALVGLLGVATGCGAAPDQDDALDGSGALGSSTQALTHACTSISADLFDHEDAGRVYGCGFLDYCATGSNQVVGDFFTLGNVRLAETNPGYWLKGSCLPATTYRWPLGGTTGAGWIVQNYVDRDSTAGVLDYRNGPKSYNGHGGIDIAVANFRQQDFGINIVAAASGVVEEFADTFDDHSISMDPAAPPSNCNTRMNYVQIRHANGSRARYYHIRKGSATPRIRVGQSVTAGTAIAQVGSSGCSTNPHLHFEVREFDSGNFVYGNLLDPFFENLFTSPPAYSNPLVLMDASLLAGDQTGNYSALINPGSNATTISRNTRFTVTAYTGNGISGDRLGMRVLRPNGTELWSTTAVMTGNETKGNWSWWIQTDNTAPTGTWSIQFRVNDVTQKTITFTMI